MKQQAALWSTRLLPFSTVLSSDPPIKDLVLSVLSELPCDVFLADMLAYCFPLSDTEDKRTMDTKMLRIITRLSSTPESVKSSDGSEPQFLSARYQFKGPIYQAWKDTAFDDKCGWLHKSFFCANRSAEDFVIDKVGNILVEFDSEYLNFLDILFTVIVSPSTIDGQSLPNARSSPMNKLNSNNHLLPYLSEFQFYPPSFKDGFPVSSSLYPLLKSLIQWSQMPSPQVTEETSGVKDSKKLTGRKLAQKRIPSSSCSMMRVNLSPPVIIGCLRQKEEEAVVSEEKQCLVESSVKKNGTAPSERNSHGYSKEDKELNSHGYSNEDKELNSHGYSKEDKELNQKHEATSNEDAVFIEEQSIGTKETAPSEKYPPRTSEKLKEKSSTGPPCVQYSTQNSNEKTTDTHSTKDSTDGPSESHDTKKYLIRDRFVGGIQLLQVPEGILQVYIFIFPRSHCVNFFPLTCRVILLQKWLNL